MSGENSGSQSQKSALAPAPVPGSASLDTGKAKLASENGGWDSLVDRLLSPLVHVTTAQSIHGTGQISLH